jgi:hypothetical protein
MFGVQQVIATSEILLFEFTDWLSHCTIWWDTIVREQYLPRS